MVNVALIIANSKYKSKDLVDLPKVTDDGVMMEEMLSSHNYEIKLNQDVEHIGNHLEKSVETWKKNVAGREIDRLHFHFSGHGVHNNKIRVDPDELETNDPVGECLYGTTGELYSVHDLSRKLLECGSKKITITLDCCRDQPKRGPDTRLKVRLRERRKLEIEEQEKIAVISGALDLHFIRDDRSLTKELYEVTHAGKTPILLTEIAKEVNASWIKKGFLQGVRSTYLRIKSTGLATCGPQPRPSQCQRNRMRQGG